MYELIAFIAVALSLKITFFLPLNNSLLIVPHTPSIGPLSMQHPGRDILCFVPSCSNVTLHNLLVYCYRLSLFKSIASAFCTSLTAFLSVSNTNLLLFEVLNL